MISANELRSKSVEELNKELLELRRSQFNLRVQYRTGQFANTSKFKDQRKEVARIKTILNEKVSSEQ